MNSNVKTRENIFSQMENTIILNGVKVSVDEIQPKFDTIYQENIELRKKLQSSEDQILEYENLFEKLDKLTSKGVAGKINTSFSKNPAKMEGK